MKRNDKMCSADKFNIAVITAPFYTAVPKIILANFYKGILDLGGRVFLNKNVKPMLTKFIVSEFINERKRNYYLK